MSKNSIWKIGENVPGFPEIMDKRVKAMEKPAAIDPDAWGWWLGVIPTNYVHKFGRFLIKEVVGHRYTKNIIEFINPFGLFDGFEYENAKGTMRAKIELAVSAFFSNMISPGGFLLELGGGVLCVANFRKFRRSFFCCFANTWSRLLARGGICCY